MSPLDQNIVSAMQNTVSWEAYQSQDGHGDVTYAAPVVLSCWVEEAGLSGGMLGLRQAHADVVDAEVELYFDGNDARVQAFTLNDRFTVSTETAAAKAVQPVRINVFRGPVNDYWVTVVSL